MVSFRNAALLSLLLVPFASHAQVYVGTLTGAAESPPNNSPATGSTIITFSQAGNSLSLNTTFSGFTGNTTVAHIHCCTTTPFTGTAGVASQSPTFNGFPVGVTSGTHVQTYDLTFASSFNGAFITSSGTPGTPATATAALAAGLASGRAYLNLHSSAFGGGEIRAFLIPNTVFADGFETVPPAPEDAWAKLSPQIKDALGAPSQHCAHMASPSPQLALQSP